MSNELPVQPPRAERDAFTTLYIRPKYARELEKLIDRKVYHEGDRSYLEVRGLRMGSPEAERIKELARSKGFLLCGQIPAYRKGMLARDNEEMTLFFHLSSQRIRRDRNYRIKLSELVSA